MSPRTREALLAVQSALGSLWLSLALIALQAAGAIYTAGLNSYWKWAFIPMAVLTAVDAYRFTVRFWR